MSRSLQLDVFRGLAAVFMVMNHAGYKWLGAVANGSGWPGFLVFVTSSAPALFFFASGVGAGMSAAPEKPASTLRKVVLLLLADACMNWGGGGWLGFDFFGFAAFSVLVLALLRRSGRPVAWAAALLVAVVLVRFALAPALRGALATNPVFAFVTGVGQVPGVSYPICPWLAFPLAGFLLGRHEGAAGAGRESMAALLVGLAGLAAAVAMARHGAVLFRWGSVSLAYFAFAVGIVAVAWIAARGASPLGRLLALRGPASLLVVPLHFAFLPMLAALWAPPWPAAGWLAATLVFCAVVVVLSRQFVALAAAWLPAATPVSDLLVAGLVVAVAACVRVWLEGELRLELECLAQLAIGLLLVRGARRPAADGARRSPVAMVKTQ